MKTLKLITAILLFPFLSIADQTESATLADIILKTSNIFKTILHYKVFSLDNQIVTIENIFIGLICLIIGLKLAKYLSKLFRQKLLSIVSLEHNSASLISRIIDYSFMAIVIIIALDIAKVPITIFTFIGGAFVVSIGLSSQHLINNFLSGIAVIIEGNIRVGDIIEFDNILGRVSKIEARIVQIKTQDNIEHFIPHSKLMQEKFSNWSYNGNRVRISTKIKIDQNDTLNKDLEIIITDAVMQNRNVIIRPIPQVLLIGFDHNMLEFEVNFWINLTNLDRRQILSEVNHQIFNALRAHHIPLATPKRFMATNNLNNNTHYISSDYEI